MKQYLEVLNRILTNGVRQPNRTGVDTLFIPGAMMQYDLVGGFPMVTTRKVPFKPIVAELIGFCRGADNASEFRSLGAKIWDKNANENGVDQAGNEVKNAWLSNPNRKGEDDLGRIYGVQWRRWRGAARFMPTSDFATGEMCDEEGEWLPGLNHDQLWTAIQTIKNNPTSRRIIVNAWRPDEFDQMSLPPCHVMFQFLCDTVNHKLHLCLYQRSCDWPIGIPFNISSYSLLLDIVARMTGYLVGTFTHFTADSHIYVNQTEQVASQLERKPHTLPTLCYDGPDLYDLAELYGPEVFEYISPDMFSLYGYDPHPAITYPFNV